MIRFALLGSAGYVAPKHMRAIKEVGGDLLASMDKHDCVGVIDQYFPESAFFTEFERFDRHLDKLKRGGVGIDYLSICTPNYLHDAHIRFGLRNGMNVICEKPLVLNPWNLDALEEMSKEGSGKVNCLFQFRYHPFVSQLREQVKTQLQNNPQHQFDVNIQYIAPRGRWYYYSWKGDESRSGGVAMNIGIHLFDLVTWIFGGVESVEVERKSLGTVAGHLELSRAAINWKISINKDEKPRESGEDFQPYRLFTVDGVEYDLSFPEGGESLHSVAYRKILNGEGVEISACREVMELLYQIRKH